MTFFELAKIFAAMVTGMLGIPLGMLPSIFLFRDRANGVDSTPASKRKYTTTLWGGMIVGWVIVTLITYWALSVLSK